MTKASNMALSEQAIVPIGTRMLQTSHTNPSAAVGATSIRTIREYDESATDERVNQLLAIGWEIMSYQVIHCGQSSVQFVCVLTLKDHS